jgi:hypothetical protein
MGDRDNTPATHRREPGVWDIAHHMTQMTIARHGIRMAMQIIAEMQHRINDAVYDQQQRHPEDWKGAKLLAPPATKPPVVSAQSTQAEVVAPKNTTKIPQIPRVGG